MRIVQNPHDYTFFSDINNVSQKVNLVYVRSIEDYHFHDFADSKISNPYPADKIEYLFYEKSWIDTVQWHFEDEIRAHDINPSHALSLKKNIDLLNQARTDVVELIDSVIVKEFDKVSVSSNAKINTESPAWALDRLSILALKIYHMNIETERDNAAGEHIRRCFQKLGILKEQQDTLFSSINELFDDISRGAKRVKAYRQMKMYNDLSLNPVLYNGNK